MSQEDDYTPIPTFSKRMPAEFEPSSMITMCYPNNMPLSVYKTIAEDNELLILVNPDRRGHSRVDTAQSEFEAEGINMDHVQFLSMDLDADYTYWARDFSPFYAFDGAELTAVDFTYNRPTRTAQNKVPRKLADYFGIGYSKMDLVHTGGNLMQDGRGRAFSDDLVVAENNDDEQKVRDQMEAFTGTEDYVITIDPQGDYIAHIDCWAKIVAPDKIIVAQLPETNARYEYYEQVAAELGALQCCYGYNYRIYRVEEPGEPTVAPYTNSLIANGHVYVPLGEEETYNQHALEVYQEALPGYTIHGVQGYSFDHYDCFLNTDALHCRTHEIPDQNMLFIDARDVYRGVIAKQEQYRVQANIVSYAGASLLDENVRLHYSVNGQEYESIAMNRYADTTNFTYIFEGLQRGDEVRYYIEACDEEGNRALDPTCGQYDPHCFSIA